MTGDYIIKENIIYLKVNEYVNMTKPSEVETFVVDLTKDKIRPFSVILGIKDLEKTFDFKQEEEKKKKEEEENRKLEEEEKKKNEEEKKDLLIN
jgi:hypothetical protein